MYNTRRAEERERQDFVSSALFQAWWRPHRDKGAADLPRRRPRTGPSLRSHRECATPPPHGSREEFTPPGLCAGPRPRPTRGASDRPGGGWVPGPPRRAHPPKFRTQPAGRKPLDLHCPPSPRAGRCRDPRHGHCHPQPSPTRSGRLPRRSPGSAPLLLRPPTPARGPFKNPARRWAWGRTCGRGGKVIPTFAQLVPPFGLRGPQILRRGKWPPIWGHEAPPNRAFFWNLRRECQSA